MTLYSLEASGEAEGVEIQSTGAVDNDSCVATFYSSDDCTAGTEIAEGNEGCIGIDGELVGAYQSFNVIPDTPQPVVSPPKRSRRGRRDRLEKACETGVLGSLLIAHGQTGTFEGIDFRWHQIHSLGFVGISPDQWDDDVHVKNAGELPRRSAPTTPAPGHKERDFVYAICQTAASCTQAAVAGGITVFDAGNEYLDCAAQAAQQAGIDVGDFLDRHPYITGITVCKLEPPSDSVTLRTFMFSPAIRPLVYPRQEHPQMHH